MRKPQTNPGGMMLSTDGANSKQSISPFQIASTSAIVEEEKKAGISQNTNTGAAKLSSQQSSK